MFVHFTPLSAEVSSFKRLKLNCWTHQRAWERRDPFHRHNVRKRSIQFVDQCSSIYQLYFVMELIREIICIFTLPYFHVLLCNTVVSRKRSPQNTNISFQVVVLLKTSKRRAQRFFWMKHVNKLRSALLRSLLVTSVPVK